MKRDYLKDMDNRIADYHTRADDFKKFIDESIRQLEALINTAKSEIDYFTKMRSAVDMTVANGRLAPISPHINSTAPFSVPGKLTSSKLGSSKALEADLEDVVEDALKDSAA